MNIEVINIYFSEEDFEKDLFTGTAHIRLMDLQIDLKGIYFKKRKEFWFVSFPSLAFIEEETKKKIRCPFLSFTDRNKHKEFQLQVKQLLHKAIEARLTQKCGS